MARPRPHAGTPRVPRRGPEQHPQAGTRRLRRDVPLRLLAWQTTVPGHFAVDLVHHNGGSATGEYVHTIQLLDVATGKPGRLNASVFLPTISRQRSTLLAMAGPSL